RIARKNLTDERQAEYDRLESMSTQPERLTLTAPIIAQSDTKVRHPDGSEEPLPTRRLHLLAAEDGTVPVDFDSSWELQVLDTEPPSQGSSAGTATQIAGSKNPSRWPTNQNPANGRPYGQTSSSLVAAKTDNLPSIW